MRILQLPLWTLEPSPTPMMPPIGHVVLEPYWTVKLPTVMVQGHPQGENSGGCKIQGIYWGIRFWSQDHTAPSHYL